MGAFFLSHIQSDINQEVIEQIYLQKGFKNHKVFDLGNCRLYLYQKINVQIPNFYEENDCSIFAIGSLFYKKLGYTQSLITLLHDFKNNCLDANALFGNYVLLFCNKQTKNLTFFIDPAFVKSVYFDKEKRIISTDFLAILNNRISNISLNRNAIIENIITGDLISPDTYVNEIHKIDRINYQKLNTSFQDINFKILIPNTSKSLDSKKSAIKDAINLLDLYFLSVKNISEEFGAHIGLTGGFDSRLLLMNARKHINNLDTNSFWRENSLEFKNAKALAQKAGLHFTSFENDTFEIPSLDKVMQNSYYVFDGQIRSQNRWNQEFALPEYIKRIANNHYVGFHGCGGEQYRNAERWKGKHSLHDFILHECLFKLGENPFIDKKMQDEIYQYILSKILRLLGVLPKKISLLEVKRIYNEIWITANRNTRLNVLNQYQFYFAPFTEYGIAHSAYLYVPYLGSSKSFQIEMMQKTDAELAAVSTNYGYSVLQGESVKEKMLSKIAANLPRKYLLTFYKKLKHPLDKKNKIIEQQNNAIQALLKGVDLSVILKNEDISFQINAFNYLFNQMNQN